MKSLEEVARVVRHEIALMVFVGDVLVGTMGIIRPTWWYGDGEFLTDRWHFALPEYDGTLAADSMMQAAEAIARSVGLKFFHQGKARERRSGVFYMRPRIVHETEDWALCFGMTATEEKSTTSTPNPAVASAATGNIDFVRNLQNQGFTPYSGQQVAGFSPQQQASFGLTDAVVGNGTGQQATNLINQYSGAPASNVQADKISNNMSPYMSQYVDSALKPQLTAYDINAGQQKNAIDAQATGSGAFGDARTGINQSTQDFLSNQGRQGLIANAYNSAFNTAIGAGAQDVSNNMQAQTTNAGLQETALNRALGGANALQGLQNQQLGVAQAQNTMGQQQTAQQQADLTAKYNQWLMAQQYPFQTAQLMNQTVGAGAAAMPASTTATTSKPDNSGLALIGTAASMFI